MVFKPLMGGVRGVMNGVRGVMNGVLWMVLEVLVLVYIHTGSSGSTYCLHL